MAQRAGTIEVPHFEVGPTSSRLITPDNVFRKVQNFCRTAEGGLRSVTTPLPWVPLLNGTNPTGPVASPRKSLPFSYGRTYGIFHALVSESQRDVMLIHTESTNGGNTGQIWEWQGWLYNWKCLIGPSSESPKIVAEIPTPHTEDWPTQFVATPTGIVIIPSRGRAYFYDGTVVLPLGYDHGPGPPVGHGPGSTSKRLLNSTSKISVGVNDMGYAMDGLDGHTPSDMHPMFRYGRLGTVETPGNVSALFDAGQENDRGHVMGYLMPGRYRCKFRWIDRWGNLSPMSPPSNDIRFARQPSAVPLNIGGVISLEWVQAECVRKEVAWASVTPGPVGTVARDLARTKDLENSGSTEYYQLPRDSAPNAAAFATMPDNVSQMYPDNIPDAWLVNIPEDIIAVPAFRLGEIALDVLFMANVPGDEGAVYWSLPGRWGTVGARNKLYPDPSAARVTGLKRVNAGCLVFTENGTYLVSRNDAGTGYRSQPLSSEVGCVAPSSIATTRDGTTIWLARDGFYGYSGGQVTPLFEAHAYDAKRFNRSRLHRATAVYDPVSGEYRCWLATDGHAKNDTCWVFDGFSWRERNEMRASGACVTKDHRRLIVTCGQLPSGTEGVFVVDRAGDPVSCTLETAWIRSLRSRERSSVRRVYLWLRETCASITAAGKIQVSVSRDYRSEEVSSSTVEPYPAVDARTNGTNPDLWDVDLVGTATKFRQRRPFWASVDIDVSSCEVYKLTITSTRRMEIIGISFDEMPRDSGGAQGYK